jgi:hypothetical protein
MRGTSALTEEKIMKVAIICVFKLLLVKIIEAKKPNKNITLKRLSKLYN